MHTRGTHSRHNPRAVSSPDRPSPDKIARAFSAYDRLHRSQAARARAAQNGRRGTLAQHGSPCAAPRNGTAHHQPQAHAQRRRPAHAPLQRSSSLSLSLTLRASVADGGGSAVDRARTLCVGRRVRQGAVLACRTEGRQKGWGMLAWVLTCALREPATQPLASLVNVASVRQNSHR